MNRSRPAIVALLTAFALVLFAAAPAAHAAGGPVRVGAAPALPAGAQALGGAPAGQQLRLYVALEPRDPAALERFATEVSTPGSPHYGNYLSVPAFAQRFGATPAQVAAVRGALAARGLDLGATGANGLSLPVQATVAAAESAFGISIERIRTASGRVAFANDRAPAIPAAAAPFVQGVLGLNDVELPHRQGAGGARSPLVAPHGALEGRPATASALAPGAPEPCQEALQVRESLGGYTADEIATAYGFDQLHAAGDTGGGQTVALLELEPVLEEDVAIYQACYGTHVELTRVDVAGGPEPGSTEDGEAALDVEQLIGLAPGAKIRVYQAPNEGDSMAEIVAEWVQENVAKVMSSSWGSCEPLSEKSEMAAFDTLLQEAAAQGQSFFVAAGDYGSTDCYDEIKHDESLAVDFPGSDPWATDVGGTRLENPTAATPTDYLWNDAPGWGAGGGGRSEQFPMPAYQLNAAAGLNVLGPLSSGETCGFSGYCRQVPDVSAEASDVHGQTGYVIHAEGAWERNGGTSAAAPLWAAAAALVNANPACAGHTIGFANPALYGIAATDYAANFRDVTTQKPGGKPTTDRYVEGEPFPAGSYYDMASGLGTPIVPGLAASLCALANPPARPAPVASSTPPPAPAAAKGPTVGRAALTGIAKGRPKLVFTVTARPGARLQTVVVQLPPALLTDNPTNTFRFRLRKPRPSAKLKLAYPAIRVSPKLRQHFKSGITRKLGFVIATRETGGKGARLPLVLPLS